MRRFSWALLMFTLALGRAQQQTTDQKVTQLLMESDRKKVSGDAAGAVKGYETALSLVKAEAALKNREEEVLRRLSDGYIAAQKPAEAVRVCRRIVALHVEDCKPGAAGLEQCANAQYGLGSAMMQAGDFAGAATQLTAAVANFSKVNMEGDEVFHMVKVKQVGDAQSLLAAALFRAGDRDKSIAMFRKAIATLQVVVNDEKLLDVVRTNARQSLKDAQASLDLLTAKK